MGSHRATERLIRRQRKEEELTAKYALKEAQIHEDFMAKYTQMQSHKDYTAYLREKRSVRSIGPSRLRHPPSRSLRWRRSLLQEWRNIRTTRTTRTPSPTRCPEAAPEPYHHGHALTREAVGGVELDPRTRW